MCTKNTKQNHNLELEINFNKIRNLLKLSLGTKFKLQRMLDTGQPVVIQY